MKSPMMVVVSKFREALPGEGAAVNSHSIFLVAQAKTLGVVFDSLSLVDNSEPNPATFKIHSERGPFLSPLLTLTSPSLTCSISVVLKRSPRCCTLQS